MAINPYRLPDDVTPSAYTVRLEPDLVNETFAGTAVIQAVANEAVAGVTLNNDGLVIAATSVNGEPCDHSIDADAERMTLIGDFAAGPLSIEISFSGEFNDQLVGFYLSRFTDDQGEAQKLATTQFEATHARKCFPCWDEPAAKATFAVELVIDQAHNAVANTAETSRQTLDDGRQVLTFAPTIPMSTYLVAFVVGPIEMTDPVDVDGVPLRIVHVPGKGELTAFALESSAFALRYFSEYFGIPYPGDKVDMVAIPDFAFGAMENLGCITFREALLLIDPTTATQPELQRAADVIHHELAHMWFGDLVTMKWWNGLWLNEAFATFMEMRCTDAFRPEWQRWVDFGVSRTAAFDTDALASTRPIEFDVVSPEEAEGMFDILTYEKGAAVVRMLEQHLGEDRFQAGIRRYMTEHAYGNAETSDLWDAIEAETGDPVRRIMDSWIFQGGFPLVSVELAPNGRTVTFSQERFGYAGGDSAAEQLWSVPLRYRWQPLNGSDPVTTQVLLETNALEIELPSEADWLVANAEGASFLRVAYPREALERLAEVAETQLAPTERYNLVDDAWAAVLADQMSANGFLVFAETMSADGDRSVWQRLISGFASIDRLLDGDARELFQAIVHDALAPALAGLGLSPLPADDDRTRQLRGDLIRAMGTIANDLEIQQEAQRTVAEGLRDPQLVEASVMAAAVDVAASIGDQADFDSFLDLYRTAGTPQEELRYLYALADFPEPNLVAGLFQRILDGEIRSQNAPFWLRRALSNRSTSQTTWDFMEANWSELSEKFPSSSIVRMVDAVTLLTRPADIQRIAAFFEANPVPQGSRTLLQILERQRVGAALREREADRLTAILVAGD
ncbi:MAG: puromycin-sensitive aminopeptidase [Acidimicrobiales bacterium]|jgi:puromycin-sensitive aminopeptidase